MNSPYTSHKNRSATPNSSDPLCNGYAQTNLRKMYMGTTLPDLHKRRGRRHGGFEWQQVERSAQESPSTKCSAPQSYDVPDRSSEQIRLKREWDDKMECLSEKYNLDYFSSQVVSSPLKCTCINLYLYKGGLTIKNLLMAPKNKDHTLKKVES